MHSYISSKKNYCWIWIAVDRPAKKFISFVCEYQSTETGMKLYQKLKYIKVCCYYPDNWKNYTGILCSENHIQSKTETSTIDGYNGRIRRYLARFKGKCYFKGSTYDRKTFKLANVETQ